MNKWKIFWRAGDCKIIQEMYSKYEAAWIFIDGFAVGILLMLIICKILFQI